MSPSLLISLHDVSPLTLDASQAAVALLEEMGVPPSRLTALVVPKHEDGPSVDRHPETLKFLRDLDDRGATLVMHGLTHRMRGRVWTPRAFAYGHLFARGQGELLTATAQDTARSLDEGCAILQRAGLAQAVRGYVPPAWLLSPAALLVVRNRGFDFHETIRGIVAGQQILARRLIGWGSLSGLEAEATAVWARIQAGRPSVDTRLAIHPADMRRPRQRNSIRQVLARLLPRTIPLAYTTFLSLQPHRATDVPAASD